VALVEEEETEANEVVWEEASLELDRFALNFGMEERFFIGVVDEGDEGTDNGRCFSELDPYGGVVRSNEVSTSVSCKLSSEVLREPLDEDEDEVSGRESWRYISNDSPTREDNWSDATSERVDVKHCQPPVTFFHLKFSAYPAERNFRECPSTLEENRVSSALIGDVSPSKSIVGWLEEEVAQWT
jgi:hypothetical protein